MKVNFKTAISQTGTHLLGIIAERGIALLLLPVLTYYLTPQEFGIFSLLYFAATATTCLITAPLGVALQRYYYSPSYSDRRDDLLGTLIILLLCKILVVGIVYWILIEPLCSVIPRGLENLGLLQLHLAVIVLMPLPALSSLLLQLKHKAKLCASLSAVSALLAAIVTLYFLIVRQAGVQALIYGQITHFFFYSISTWPEYLKQARWKISWHVAKEPLKWGYPLLPAAYSNLVIQSGDRYLLAVLGNLNAVGLYDVGYRLSSVVSVALYEPVKRGLHPLIMKMEADTSHQKKTIRSATNLFYLCAIFLALAISLFAKEIITCVAKKPEFWEAWLIVPIITFSYVQNGLGHFFNYGLVMTNRTKYISLNLFIACATNIVLNIILIPYYGILGAAIATLACYFVWNSLKIYYSKKFYGLEFDLLRLTHITIIGVGVFVVALSFTSLFQWNLGQTILLKTCALAIYPVLLYFTRYFTPSEREKFMSLLATFQRVGFRGAWKRLS